MAQVAGNRGMRMPHHRWAVSLRMGRATPFYFQAFLPGETVSDFYVDGRVLISGLKSVLYPWYCDLVIARVNLLDIQEEYAEQFYAARTTPVDSEAADPDFGVSSTDTEAYSKFAYQKLCREFFVSEGQEVTDTANLFVVPPKWRSVWASPVDSATVLEDPDLEEADLDPEHHRDLVDTVDTMQEVLDAYGVRRSRQRASGCEIIAWEKMERYPVYVAPDDNSEVLTNRQVLFQLKSSRLTTKGHYIDQPCFFIGVIFIRPEIVLGGQDYFYANELMGRDRWFVPPFNALDAVQTLLNDPDDWAYTTPTDPVYVNALDYWTFGESFINVDPSTASNDMAACLAKLPNYSGSAWVHEHEVFSSLNAGVYDNVPNVFNTSYFMQTVGHIQSKVRTHLIEA